MRVRAYLCAAVIALAGTLATVQLASPVPARAGAHPSAAGRVSPMDETTASQNLLRNGWDPNEPGLSPAIVSGGSFGQLFDTQVNGQVYAQPLVVDDTSTQTSRVIVATENNWVYSLDGYTGAVKWSRYLGPSWPASVNHCADLTPDIGATSTPVYDPSTGVLYLTAVVNEGPTQYQPDVYLFAINEQTGAVDWRVPIKGAPVNDPGRPFNSLTERQRTSLLLLGGSIYMGFGSYCDYSPYVGYVVGVNTTTKALTMWTDQAGLTDEQAGIWMGGSGLMSDGPGRIFLVSGNGVSPAAGPGTSPPPELGDSVVRLGVGPSGTLSAQDFFSPANAPTLDVNDQDYGSGGVVGLPFGTSTYPDLLLAAGKDGRVFMLNANSLGGRETGPGGTDNPVSMSGPYGGEWGRPAAFAGAGGDDFVYYVGSYDSMRALQFNGSSPSAPTLTDVGNSTVTFGYTSGSPVVTSNGTDPSSAVVWEVYSPNEHGTSGPGKGGILEAYDAMPQGGQLKEIWSAPIGTAAKFTVPATDNGRVYVGTRDGTVLGFGSPSTAPVQAPTTAFGQDPLGTAKTATVNVTVPATAATVTITKVSIASTSIDVPFAAGTPAQSGKPVTLPVTLGAGQTLSVPVTFRPGSPGGFTASLVVATKTPNFPTVSFPLNGDGTRAGLYASQTALPFGTVPVGSSRPLPTDIINGGTSTEKVSAVTGATAPFGITGIARNTSIPPGGSVTVTVTFRPTVARTSTGTITVTGTGPGTSAKLTLTARSVAGRGVLTAPATVSFGRVPLGQFASRNVTIDNTGNLPVTITRFTAPAVPFGTPAPVTAGLTLTPGVGIQLPVTYAPQSLGMVTGKYQITYRDGRSPAKTLTILAWGNGTAPASGVAVPSPGGGWTFNGSAQMSGTTLQLTPARKDQAGSAVYYQPMASNGLNARFTARLSGGNGADGMTFALLNPASSSVYSAGGDGGMFGFGGLSGVAVVLGTHKDAGDPSGNFVGIATGTAHGHLVFAATSTKVPNLRARPVTVGVLASGGRISVWVDGKQYLAAAVKLPAGVLPAFTAGTGVEYDIHAVYGVTLYSGAVAAPPPGGGWSYNGSARMAGSAAVLTQPVTYQAGSVVYPRPVESNGLHARFNIELGGGTGADGLTFALLSPPASATSLGANGAGLGFTGLSGVALTFATFETHKNPLTSFAAIVTGANGTLTYRQYAMEIGQLRSGTHDVSVTVQNGVLLVYFDGQQVLQYAVSLPPSVLLAYTGGTGALTDYHIVRNAAISAAGW